MTTVSGTDGTFTVLIKTDDRRRSLRLVASVEASPSIAETDSPEIELTR